MSDPFGRGEDDETDAFGRPLKGPAPESERLWRPPAEAETQAEAPSQQWLPPVPEGSDDPVVARPLDFSPPAQTAPGGRPIGRKAAYGDRVGAAVMDGFIRLAIILVIAVPLALAMGVDGDGDETVLTAVLIAAIPAMFYAPVMMARTGGQTFGHRATGTRVVRVDGKPLTGAAAATREVVVKAALIEFAGGFLFGVPALVNYLWPLWDDKGEALHDKICSTRVVEA